MKFDVIVSNPPFSLDKWAKGFEIGNTETIIDGKRKIHLRWKHQWIHIIDLFMEYLQKV